MHCTNRPQTFQPLRMQLRFVFNQGSALWLSSKFPALQARALPNTPWPWWGFCSSIVLLQGSKAQRNRKLYQQLEFIQSSFLCNILQYAIQEKNVKERVLGNSSIPIQDSTAYALNSKAFSIRSSRPSSTLKHVREAQRSLVKLSLSASNSGGHGPSTRRPCGKTASKAVTGCGLKIFKEFQRY